LEDPPKSTLIVIFGLKRNHLATLAYGRAVRRKVQRAARVTSLGEFSHVGRLFSLGRFLKNEKGAQFFGPLIFQGYIKMCINFDTQKPAWATIWAIFSQTHPVTLAVTLVERRFIFEASDGQSGVTF
jgi:hypothetical protein